MAVAVEAVAPGILFHHPPQALRSSVLANLFEVWACDMPARVTLTQQPYSCYSGRSIWKLRPASSPAPREGDSSSASPSWLSRAKGLASIDSGYCSCRVSPLYHVCTAVYREAQCFVDKTQSLHKDISGERTFSGLTTSLGQHPQCSHTG